MTKTFTPTGNSKKYNDNIKRHKHFDYTTIADRLRTVSCSNDNQQTGLVKQVLGIPTFLLTAKAVQRTHIIYKILNV